MSRASPVAYGILPDARGVPDPDLVEQGRVALEAMNRQDLDALMSFYAPDAVNDLARSGDADGLIELVIEYTDIDEARAAAERLAESRGQAMSQESS